MQIIVFLILCAFVYRFANPAARTYPATTALNKEMHGPVSFSRVLLMLAGILAAAAAICLLIVLAALAKHHLPFF